MPGKNPTVKSLKIGDTLSFGAYSAQGQGENPVPILWIKASTNSDFVSEYVLDYLVFDEKEEWGPDYRPFGVPFPAFQYYGHNSGGDPNYSVSNILQFLNSTEDGGRWFHPMHEHDVAPRRTSIYHRGYDDHAGFLRHFTETELNAMVNWVATDPYGDASGLVHLMSADDVYGDNKLPLFRKRRGIRARPSDDLLMAKSCHIAPGRYMTYALRSRHNDQWIGSVGTIAHNHGLWPSSESGIRPIIRLDPDAKIAPGLDGAWEVVGKRRRTFFDDTAISECALSLLGLV